MSVFPASAPTTSDAVFVFELLVGVGLVIGALIVRRGNVRAHKYLQSSMILVNLPVILVWMIPQFLTYVLPGIPKNLGQVFYFVPTMMLVAGSLAEGLGVYILLVAGTNWLPERLRFQSYKRWMRTELVLWWLVLLLGFTTYYVWYVPH